MHASSKPRGRSSRAPVLAWIALAVLAFAVHGVSLPNPFVFDDIDAIVDNPARLWPPGAAFSAPAGSGASGRPLVALSIAVDRTLFGLRPAGWHAVNIALLVLLGGAIFVLLRATLADCERPAWVTAWASPIAFAGMAIWIVHPLHSAVIDHVVYRNEILAGLLIVVVLLCVRRSASSPGARRRWAALAVLASAAAMASKETGVVAPLLAWCYDALFLAGSWRVALRQRASLYAGLAATWLVLGACLAAGDRGASVTIQFADVSRLDYARTQLGVVAHYLRLAFWPQPLVLDYDWPIAPGFGAVAAPALVIILLLAVTVLALARRRGIGFLGVAFFLLLAPSSSIVPLTGAVAAEHRMSVPLACVAIVTVLAAASLLARAPLGARARSTVGIGAVVVAIGLLGTRAIDRHRDFATTIGIWQDTAVKAPHNPRAHGNWGAALLAAGREEESIAPLSRALELQPAFDAARKNLAAAHAHVGFAKARGRGGMENAVEHWRRAVELDPGEPATENALAWVLATSMNDALRDPEASLLHARRAQARAPEVGRAEYLDTLAAAYAANAAFDSARAIARTAHDVALQAGDRDLAQRIAERAALYAAHQPYRGASKQEVQPRRR